ncbi:DUF3011 domain-containing protein [Xanthomonas nasturtii]|uniref:DUF3011 domain-containing protein n=1 Tax=Xanthomonas nasturtii TaxID=1843581 RepID=UPI00201396EF|nr:DUF3011 domain-containing protein [Xanthomonas nasturtii]MCL1559935.1 DUF3011 domain-containing protein [Xanthomonas nasturtii]
MLRTALLLSGFGLITLTGLLASASAAAQERGWNGPSITCSSNDNRRRECDTPFRGRAVLVENISGTRCIEGRNWGSDRGRIWVNDGCRGEFAQARGGGGWDRGDGDYAGRDDRPRNDYAINCASDDRRLRTCAWDGRYGRPVLTRQLSDTRCEEGRSWGYDDRRATVWVNDGCRARFEAR